MAMDSYYHIGIFAVVGVMYSVFLLRRSSGGAPFVGHGLFQSLLLWTGATSILSWQGQLVANGDLADWYVIANVMKLVALALFFYLHLRDHINTPLLIISTGIVGVVMSVVGVSHLVSPSVTLSLIGFGGVCLALTLLMFIERLYQVGQHQRKRNRHLIISFGAIALVDVIAYVSQMVGGVTPGQMADYQAAAVLAVSPFVYRGVNILQVIPVKVSLSRPIAFQSFLFMSVGVYLLVMGCLAYFVSYMGFGVGLQLQLAIAAVVVMPVIYALVSQKMRRSIWVWINKHFFADQFDYRKTWLTMTKSWDPAASPEEAACNGLGVMMSALMSQSGAVFRVRRNNRLSLLCQENMNLSGAAVGELARIAEQAQDTGWIIDVGDMKQDPSLYPMISQTCDALYESGVKWIIPARQSSTVTTLVLLGNEFQQSWTLNWEMRDFMNALAQQIDSYIHAQIKHKELSEHAQMTAFHQTSAFVIHDLKNVFAQLSMLNKNAEAHSENPDFIKDAFVTLNSMQKRMETMLGKLTNKQSEVARSVSVSPAALLSDVIMAPELQEHPIVPALNIDSEVNDAVINVDDDRLKSIIRNLVDNAQHACKSVTNPSVSVHCSTDENYVNISISDNGIGMSESFVKERLFRLFDTTKSNAGMGIGMYDAKCFIEEMDGDINVTSALHKGTTILLSIPRS